MRRTTWTIAAALMLAACAGQEAAVPAPGPVVTLADSATGNPTVARAGDTTYVAWVAAKEGLEDVYLQRVGPDGNPAGAAVRVNATSGDASTHDQAPPQVVVGPGGVVYVVWQKSRPVEGRTYDASDLRFAASTDGGRSFGPTLTINDDAGGPPSSHTFHDAVVAPDGTVYVAWLDGRVKDSTRAAWIEQGKLEPTAAPPMHHHGAEGELHHEMEPEIGAEAALPGSEVRLASWNPGASAFTASVVVDRDVCPCCRVSLATAPDGALYVAWRKIFPGSIRDIAVARSRDGGRNFSSPVRVHDDHWKIDGCPHAGPALAVDAGGQVDVAWYTGAPGAQGLYLARSSDGGKSFGQPVALEAGDWVPPSQVKLAAAGGRVWVAWDDRRAEEPTVQLGRLVSGEVVKVGSPVPGHSPALAAAGEEGTLAWQHGQAVRFRTMGGTR